MVRKRTLNTDLFKGLAEAPRAAAALPNVEDTDQPGEGVGDRQAVSLSRSATFGAAKRYRRLHLYVSDDTLPRIRRMQAEALAAGLPMGQRGPSVIMAAALDRFEQLSQEDRLQAVRNRLGAITGML
jgi:hypothetical protein